MDRYIINKTYNLSYKSNIIQNKLRIKCFEQNKKTFMESRVLIELNVPQMEKKLLNLPSQKLLNKLF